MSDELDLGYLREGVVEAFPYGQVLLRCGTVEVPEYFDVMQVLRDYEGQEVRVIVVPLATVETLASLMDAGCLNSDQVPKAGG